MFLLYTVVMDFLNYILIGEVVLAVLILIPMFRAGLSLAPYCPVPKVDLERINRLARLENGQTFYEIGCGDGRVCHYLAQQNPGVWVIAIEMAWPLFLWARMRQFFSPVSNLTIKLGDALREDLSSVDVVYFFMLSRTINSIIKPKLERELKKGSCVMSYECVMNNWKGASCCDESKVKGKDIHLYYA